MNASSPMYVTEGGITIAESEVQFRKVQFAMAVTFRGIVMAVSLMQPLKALSPIEVMEDGKVIFSSD